MQNQEPFVVLTFRIKEQWEQFWSNRPTEEPFDLLDILEDAYPIPPDELDFPVKPGYKAFGSKDLPGLAFMAVEDYGERKFVGLFDKRNCNRHRFSRDQVHDSVGILRQYLAGLPDSEMKVAANRALVWIDSNVPTKR